eukprot:6067796-Alexandrium_andersonii.AAC.2
MRASRAPRQPPHAHGGICFCARAQAAHGAEGKAHRQSMRARHPGEPPFLTIRDYEKDIATKRASVGHGRDVRAARASTSPKAKPWSMQAGHHDARAHPSTHTHRQAQYTMHRTPLARPRSKPAPTVGPPRATPPEVRPTRRGASQAGPA